MINTCVEISSRKQSTEMDTNRQDVKIYDRRRCAYPLGYNAEKDPALYKRLPSYYRSPVTVCFPCLPEAAPPNIMLAQILHIGSLCNQLCNLFLNSKLLVLFKVLAHQFILHARQYL